ncbi:MAG TPA: Rieske 2Fe-2S domain-containing protein [Acidimicrobiales bacterium]|nr:Rieske 2Fe-2S domain-containing protein [Acidimicrobiales bacterium]
MTLDKRVVAAPFSPASAGWALLPLRAFLGFTFTFAGLQKLANPGFFDANNPTSIQQQLKESAHSSPVHALISPLVSHAVALGVVMALGELAVGLGTLLGLRTRIAAVGGMILSLCLFLTVSFHSSPYYTGSDIVFFFAWLPLLVSGSGDVLSVDALLASRTGTGAGAGPAQAPSSPTAGAEIDRRTFALKATAVGAVGAVGVLLAGAAAGLGRLVGHYATFPAAANPNALSGTATSSGTPTSTAPAAGSTSTTAPVKKPPVKKPPGKAVGPASAVTIGGAATFNDPKTGDPAVVLQPTAGTFVAFDAICPHEGCTVAFNTDAKLFICPCHGSRFNGETGDRISGPAPHGLTRITIAEGPDGDLYAV